MKPSALLTWVRRLGVNLSLLVFMLVFVVGMAVSTAYIIYRLRAEEIAHHAMIAALQARDIEDHLTQSFNIINQILTYALYSSEDDLTQAQIVRHFGEALQITPALRSISLLDANELIVASSNPANLGIKVDSTDYLPSLSTNNELPRIGRSWSGRDFGSGTPSNNATSLATRKEPSLIPVVRNLRLGKRTLALAIAVNTDYFINHYATRVQPEEGFVEVLRHDGSHLLSTDDRFSSGVQPRDRTFLAQISEMEFGSFEETLHGDTPVITAFRASRLFPLVVVTRIRRDYALKEWTEESRRLLLTVSPALLAVIVLSILLYSRLRRIEEQQAEARQRERERLAATVFQTVDEAVLVTEASNRIIAVNPAFTRITGYAEDEVIGSTPRLLASDKHTPEFFAAMSASLIATGSWQGEIWNHHKNGKLYMAWLSIKQVRNKNGALTHNVAAFSDITDRKQAEEAQIRAVIEASPDAVLLVNGDGSIGFANQVSERVFGYTLAEATGLDIGKLVPMSYRARHAQHVSDFNRNPSSRPMASGVKLMAVRRDGSEFPAEISLSHMKMGDQSVVFAAVSDITQRTLNEEALRVGAARLELALEGSRDGVWDWNIQTNQVQYSRRRKEILGYFDGELGLDDDDWEPRIHPDDKSRVMADIQATFDGKTEVYSNEHRQRCKDGNWKWLLARGKVVSRDANGKPLRAIGTTSDISERKQTEAALMASMASLNEAQRLAHVGSWELDLATGKLLWSDEVFRIFEIDKKLFGASYEAFLDAIHPQDRDQVNQAYSDSLVSHDPYEISHRLCMADGRIKWVNERCETFFDKQGGALRSAGTVQDITARKQMELDLRSAKEAAEALLERASMAERRIVDISEQTQEHIGQELHDDLGQHLTGIAFLSEILFRKLEALKQGEKEDATNITRLINAAVVKTKTLAQGLYPVELKEAGLRSMVEQLSRNVETVYGVQCQVCADDDFRIGDPGIAINLFRMIQEAINNAIKHGRATNIRIGMFLTPNGATLEISDDGGGLNEPEAAPKKKGLGMQTMRYRATLIGAVLQIAAGENGGVRVVINLPIPEEKTGPDAIQRTQ